MAWSSPAGSCGSTSGLWPTSGPAGQAAASQSPPNILAFAGAPGAGLPLDPAEMVLLAGELEDEGQLAGRPKCIARRWPPAGRTAEICFLLAELLYQMHDLPAARERYYMAIELDEDYVEARANLGCVLADLGERELAISAFEGALAYHDALSGRPLSPGPAVGRSRPSRRGRTSTGRPFCGCRPTAPGPTKPAQRLECQASRQRFAAGRSFSD